MESDMDRCDVIRKVGIRPKGNKMVQGVKRWICREEIQ